MSWEQGAVPRVGAASGRFFHASISSHANQTLSKSRVRKPSALLSAVGFSSRIARLALRKSTWGRVGVGVRVRMISRQPG